MKYAAKWIACLLTLLMLIGMMPVCAAPLDTPVTYQLTDCTDDVKLVGRTTVNEDGIAPHTTGAGIAFYSDCSGDITLTMTAVNTKFNSQVLAVFVDGVLQERVECKAPINKETTKTLTVVKGLEAGLHRIEIVRDTEENYGSSVFNEITLNGTMTPVPEAPIMIEFVGDSLTAGYASNDRDKDTMTLSVEHPVLEVGTQAYAYLTAQALGADFQSCCASGYGVVCGWNADRVTLTDMYEYAGYYHQTDKWEFKRKADVVVINLGSNDNTRKSTYGISDDEVVAGIKAFMLQVRDKNPDAKIVWVTGLGGIFFKEGIEATVAELGGADAGYYCFTDLPYGASGGAGHPSLEEHIAASNVLVEYLKNNVLPADYAADMTTVSAAQRMMNAGVLSAEDAALLQLECNIAAADTSKTAGMLTAVYQKLKPADYVDADDQAASVDGSAAQVITTDNNMIMIIIAIVAAVIVAGGAIVFGIVYKPKKKTDTAE